ncbi:hypothetical protein ACFVH6_22190 [Spirillospora sp. NPDC127200]
MHTTTDLLLWILASVLFGGSAGALIADYARNRTRDRHPTSDERWRA